MKLPVDTNVVLDVLAQREPWCKDSSRLLTHIEQGGAGAVFLKEAVISPAHKRVATARIS